jgi:soluble lytic murein transglycosylase
MFSIKRGVKNLVSLVLTLGLFIIIASVIISALYPVGYKNYINRYSKEYDLDPFLVASVINVESKYDKNATSSKDARGLMQIGESTGQWASEVLAIDSYTSDMLYDPEINIRIGTWYLNQLNKEFDNNLDLVLAAYNAGSGNVSKWLLDEEYSKNGEDIHTIPFKETKDYLKRVNLNYEVYSTVYKYYMPKPDNNSSLYVELIIYIKEFLKTNINKMPKGEKF